MGSEVAVVTGGSRGIGAAAAIELGRLGYRVVVNYFSRADAANAVLAEIRAAGGDGIAVAGDVRDPAQAQGLIEAALAEYGRLDALVCNAAMPVTFTPFGELDFADFTAKVSGELAAAFHPVRYAVPSMLAQGSGQLVFVSSGLSRRAPSPGAIALGTAKAALNTFAQYLAVTYGPHGITANVILPGYIHTENSTARQAPGFEEQYAAGVPLRRVGQPADVGRVIARIASDTNGFVTGALIPVTGGQDVA